MNFTLRALFIISALIISSSFSTLAYGQRETVAIDWIEVMLEAIRNDEARPTVHARNLHHVSAAMYDAWTVYDQESSTYLVGKEVDLFKSIPISFNLPSNINEQRQAAISHAAYRLLSHRFNRTAGAEESQLRFNNLMESLGYDINDLNTETEDGNGVAVGNKIAQYYIDFGLQDGSNEFNNYLNRDYTPANPPLILNGRANPTLLDLNRWQPLAFDIFIDQAGLRGDGIPDFLGAEWGNVTPFALREEDKSIVGMRDGAPVYYDPGLPWQLENDDEIAEQYIWNFSLVANWSSHLDPRLEEEWDISPGAIGNNPVFPEDMTQLDEWYDYLEGGEPGQGHELNPVTGALYSPNIVKRGDFARVLAEFWADGPDSETPPGHWFTIANKVLLDERLEYKYRGVGPLMDPLEYQIKLFFTLGGAVHDAAVAAWDIKAEYDYIRPISYIRWAADKQRTDPSLDNYDPRGLPIIPGFIEPVLQGDDDFPLREGQMKIKTWRGPEVIFNPRTDFAGVDWVLAETWWPYQRATFVTPPFAGYISGHSTFSRAAAQVLTEFTGSPFFPGGMGTFMCRQNQFLVFERGPSTNVELQWATYYDASDQSGLSRIWGGIHPPIDDIPGRIIGKKIGLAASSLAHDHFTGTINKPDLEPSTLDGLTISPNPISSGEAISLQFLRSLPADVQITIFDSQGRLFYSTQTSGVNKTVLIYPTEPLHSGLYFVRAESAGEKFSSKFVVF